MTRMTCALCGISGERRDDEGWNEKKRMEEFMELTPECAGDELEQVCDDCFQSYKIWLSKQTPEDRGRMRREG